VPKFIATVDTSVLVSLQSAELLGAVSVLFDRLLVPTRVREELEEGQEGNRIALRAMQDFAIFEACSNYDRTSVDLLLKTRKHLNQGEDEGEAEAVIQAAQGSASMVLTDDGLGREWAQRHALECHGTIWICYELRRTGYLTQLRSYFVRMIERGRRQPLVGMNAFLLEFGEPLITEEEHRKYSQRRR